MPAIYPIATSRVSDSLIQARLISQFEFDNQELARLQDQVSTGYRISTPSQDAPAAIRAITLQRWLEQKEQAKVNLETTNSFISASDTALTGATDLLNYVQSVALSAIDTTATVEQRRVLRTEVERALQQFLDIGNRQFRGRYLFAGSQTTTQPFELQGQYVAYRGNLTRLQNFADVDYLSDTNISGADAFGAISAEVRGTADLNPILTESTKLSDLREGRGITRGSIQISDGTHTSIVDLSSATTIRDVIQRIEARPPAGREINVTLSRDGLILQLDDGGGGNLTITEVPGGTTASDLGIYNPTGSGTAPFQGRDLDPRLTLLTRLDQILGSRASARIESAGQSNDIRIEAVQNGAAYNGVTVQFINSAASGDQALASYDAGTQTLTIDVSPDVTRAATVVAAINGTGAFTATLDDKLDALNDGNGLIDVTATAVTSGGAGEDFDAAAGLRIENAGEVHTFNFAGAETI
ncbi:MAG: flagellar hook-associated protein FlgL, partial [Pirellulaceae bacterium]